MKKYIGLSLLLTCLSGCYTGMESALNDRSSRPGSIIGDSWGYESSDWRSNYSNYEHTKNERRENQRRRREQERLDRIERQLDW